MNKKTQPNRPSHTAYVVDGEGDNTNWTEIGALWVHEDGKGFNLNLKALPLDGRIVIRARKPKTEIAQ